MAKKAAAQNGRADLPVSQDAQPRVPATKLKSSSLLDTRVVYCGDNLEQLAKLPDGLCRTGQFWGETKEKRVPPLRDHENTKAYPATAGRPRYVQLARVLKPTGSFYYGAFLNQ
jgi:hypothetical protein